MNKRIILASSSPRRNKLLARIISDFEVIPASILEEMVPGFRPDEQTIENALRKARDVSLRYPDAVVIGADTVVILKGRILGKPASPEEAIEMLEELSGRTHSVITGLAIVNARDGIELMNFEKTDVTFRILTEKEIRNYVAAGTCLDKAGAYGIQEIGDSFIESINGEIDNVIGLPLELVSEMLEEISKLMGIDKKV